MNEYKPPEEFRKVTFTGSPSRALIPIKFLRKYNLLINKLPAEYGLVELIPGTTGKVRAWLVPKTPEAKWTEKDERWYKKYIKLLRLAYHRRGQSEKKIGDLTVNEWIKKIPEDSLEAKQIIEDMWQAYGKSHDFSRKSILAFKKMLAYHGIKVSYVGSEKGRYEWDRTHPEPLKKVVMEEITLVCPYCGNNDLIKIKTNEFSVHQCLVCLKGVWPL